MSEYKSRMWWRAKKDIVHKRILDSLESITAEQSYRYEYQIHQARMYSNREPIVYGSLEQHSMIPKDRITMNVIKEIIDTMVAHYGLQKILPIAVTDGGDWKMRRRGEKMNTFILGMFKYLKLYRLGPKAIRDGCIFQKGAIWFETIGGKIHAERVYTPELIFDEAEAADQNPRILYRVRDISRTKLYEDPRFKGKKKIIDKATQIDVHRQCAKLDPNEADLVTLIDTIKLPSKDGEIDGRWTTVTTAGVLNDRKYTRQKFPCAIFEYPGEEGHGIWGASVVCNQQARQMEINLLLQKIQRQMRASSFKLLVERGSKVVKEHLTNEDGTVIYYNGTQPQGISMQAVAPETFKQLENLRKDAFEAEGINRLSSHGELPPGIKSGIAQSIYIDEGSKRMRYMGRSVEWFYIDCAHNIIALAKEMYDNGEGSMEIMTETNNGLEAIDWSKVDLDEDKYQLSIMPTNFFSQSAAMKFEQANEMLDRQILTIDEWMSLTDNPDLKSLQKRRNSGYREIEYAIDMMHEGKDVVPDSTFTNLEMAGPMVQMAYLEAKNSKAPEEILEKFRNYLLSARELTMKIKNEAQQQQMQIAQAQQQAAPPPKGATDGQKQPAGPIPGELGPAGPGA